MCNPLKLLRFLSVIAAVALVSLPTLAKNAIQDPELAEMFKTLAVAENELEGRTAESAIWEYWFAQSPTAEVREELDQGIERREAYDYESAEAHFSRVIKLAPDYAEGYNQRAFIRFLRENDVEAKVDLEKALELEPNHFGAYSGMFHVLLRQDRQDAAFGMLKQAMVLHPWIQERYALPQDQWPDSVKAIHSTDKEI